MIKKTLFAGLLIMVGIAIYFKTCGRCLPCEEAARRQNNNNTSTNTQPNPKTAAKQEIAIQPAIPKPPCIDPKKAQATMNCPELNQPVCGCDGITYKNPCEAFKKGLTSIMPGQCK